VSIILANMKTVVQLKIQISQGTATTDLRWGGRFYSSCL